MFKKWDDLDNVIHILQATANTYYSPCGELEKGWNILLKKRDELKPFIESEIFVICNEIDELDKEWKKIKNAENKP